MRRYAFYFLIALLAFGIGLVVTFRIYLNPTSKTEVNEPVSADYLNYVNKLINQIESQNAGFDELSKAEDGVYVTVQGFIDEKFLCLDVTDLQHNVCTTVLIGSSLEKKSLLIRFQVCNEQNKSNCIVWQPNNRCGEDRLCSDAIEIYDKNSNSVQLYRYVIVPGGRGRIPTATNIQLKITGKIL
jgi:hypothetical protein